MSLTPAFGILGILYAAFTLVVAVMAVYNGAWQLCFCGSGSPSWNGLPGPGMHCSADGPDQLTTPDEAERPGRGVGQMYRSWLTFPHFRSGSTAAQR